MKIERQKGAPSAFGDICVGDVFTFKAHPNSVYFCASEDRIVRLHPNPEVYPTFHLSTKVVIYPNATLVLGEGK